MNVRSCLVGLLTMLGIQLQLFAVAVSQERKHGQVEIREISTRKVVSRIDCPGKYIAFHPDGKRIVGVSTKGEIREVNWRTKEVRTAQWKDLIPEDKKAYASSEDPKIKCIYSGSAVEDLRSVFYSPDGRFLVLQCESAGIIIVNNDSFQIVATFCKKYGYSIGGSLFSPDSKWVIYHVDKSPQVTSTQDWTTSFSLNSSSYLGCNANQFTPDGNYLVIGACMEIWDWKERKLYYKFQNLPHMHPELFPTQRELILGQPINRKDPSDVFRLDKELKGTLRRVMLPPFYEQQARQGSPYLDYISIDGKYVFKFRCTFGDDMTGKRPNRWEGGVYHLKKERYLWHYAWLDDNAQVTFAFSPDNRYFAVQLP